jgi:peptide/nickel transport system permease protein
VRGAPARESRAVTLRRTWRERLRGTEEVLREVWSQTMGKLGIILIVWLVITAVYALIAVPPNFVELWTHNVKYWETNPPLAEPTWVKYFGVPTAPHVIKLFSQPSASGIGVFNFTPPGGAPILTVGYMQNYTFTYRLTEKAFPKGIIAEYVKVVPGNVSGSPVLVTPYILVTRPDGVTVLVNSPQPVTLKDLAARGVERYDTNTIVSQFTYLFPNLSKAKAQGLNIKLVFGTYSNGELKPLRGTYTITLVLIYTAPGVSPRQIADAVESGQLGVQKLKVIVQGSAYGLMGTDDKGRDLYLGLLYGFPVALLIGFFAAVSSVIIGLIAGVVSGYYGGWVDEAIQRTVDVIGNIPLLPILVIIGVAMQAMDVSPWIRLFAIIGAIIVFGWGGLAIIVRSMTLSIKAEPYIDAAKAIGASNMRIIFHHIIPQIVPYAMATLVFSVPGAILIEAGLSVLGIHHGLPTWGSILSDAEGYVRSGGSYGIWWWILPPGILIGLTSLAFVLLGLALETIVEPRLRRR